jgi:hypothetical protein
MDEVIYESNDTSLLGLIEEVFKDNNIPIIVTGASEIGLASFRPIQVRVSKEHLEEAKNILEQILS